MDSGGRGSMYSMNDRSRNSMNIGDRGSNQGGSFHLNGLNRLWEGSWESIIVGIVKVVGICRSIGVGIVGKSSRVRIGRVGISTIETVVEQVWVSFSIGISFSIGFSLSFTTLPSNNSG